MSGAVRTYAIDVHSDQYSALGDNHRVRSCRYVLLAFELACRAFCASRRQCLWSPILLCLSEKIWGNLEDAGKGQMRVKLRPGHVIFGVNEE